MDVTVWCTDDPAAALEAAGTFLEGEPVDHNLILSLLSERVRDPEPGRYRVAAVDGRPVGAALQSPRHFPVVLTPMPAAAAVALADDAADAGDDLPGVSGDPGAAARFAGRWSERRRCPAVPVLGLRIHEVTDVRPPADVAGAQRTAGADDRALIADWLVRFHEDVHETGHDVDQILDRRLPAGEFRLWEDDGPVSLAALTAPVAGVARVQAVYTPDDARGRGYAAANVATLSAGALDAGLRCILFTDLGNPTSNSVYRRIGYRAVSEVVQYRFG